MTLAIDLNEVVRDFLRAFIRCYNKGVDEKFKIDYDDINTLDLWKIFPFYNEDGENDKLLYDRFLYEDYAFELYSRADLMVRNLISTMNIWINGDLRNFDESLNPNVIIFSPFEANLSIPSTLGFLARVGLKAREFYFPMDSATIWEKADVVITANPKLIKSCPEGKMVLKINAPYNKDVEAEHSYDEIQEIIYNSDGKDTLNKFILSKHNFVNTRDDGEIHN